MLIIPRKSTGFYFKQDVDRARELSSHEGQSRIRVIVRSHRSRAAGNKPNLSNASTTYDDALLYAINPKILIRSTKYLHVWHISSQKHHFKDKDIMSRPNTLFGGGLIGTSFTTPEQVQELLDVLKTLKIDRIDTAARYSPTNPGSSERLLGELRAAEQGFTIDTKINTVSSASSDGSGSLTAAAIEKSLIESFNRLKVDKVNILYFHRPDPQTPVVEQVAEIQRQYLAGRFEKVFVFHIC